MTADGWSNSRFNPVTDINKESEKQKKEYYQKHQMLMWEQTQINKIETDKVT